MAVILAYDGLLFVPATPLLRLRAPVLAAAVAVWCVAGPVLSHVLRAGRRAGTASSRGLAVAACAGSALLPSILVIHSRRCW